MATVKPISQFDKGWAGFVLPMLTHRIASGPVDWNNPPKLEPVARTLKVTLQPR